MIGGVSLCLGEFPLVLVFTSFLKGNGDETWEREEGKEWREDLVIVLRNGGEE